MTEGPKIFFPIFSYSSKISPIRRGPSADLVLLEVGLESPWLSQKKIDLLERNDFSCANHQKIGENFSKGLADFVVGYQKISEIFFDQT